MTWEIRLKNVQIALSSRRYSILSPPLLVLAIHNKPFYVLSRWKSRYRPTNPRHFNIILLSNPRFVRGRRNNRTRRVGGVFYQYRKPSYTYSTYVTFAIYSRLLKAYHQLNARGSRKEWTREKCSAVNFLFMRKMESLMLALASATLDGVSV